MPIKFDLTQFSRDKKIFIETGTYLGGGIRTALNSGFNIIHSIELDKRRYDAVKNKFKNKQNVYLYHGNSGVVLEDVMKNINEPVVFWLDAHFNGDNAEYGDKWCPLNEELNIINSHHIKTHTILIDDIRCMDNTHFDAQRNIPVGFPGRRNLLRKIKIINPEYKLTYLNGVIPNDVLCAQI